MNIKANIPNLLTIGNLLCGCLLMLVVLPPHRVTAESFDMIFRLLVLAALLDFADGLVARALHVSSAIGGQLDSFADMVTFGVFPGFVSMAVLVYAPLPISEYSIFIFLIVPAMSAVRLAKFNLDTEQTEHFKGLPTPIHAFILTGTAYLIIANPNWHTSAVGYAFTAFAIITSLLLVSNVPLLALKFKSFDWRTNQAKYILVISAIILWTLFKFIAIPLMLPVYILVSFLHFKWKLI